MCTQETKTKQFADTSTSGTATQFVLTEEKDCSLVVIDSVQNMNGLGLSPFKVTIWRGNESVTVDKSESKPGTVYQLGKHLPSDTAQPVNGAVYLGTIAGITYTKSSQV